MDLKGLFDSEGMKEKYSILSEKVAEHSSRAERIAQDAERELDKIKIAEYMSKNAGKEFSGSIKSFNKYGIYVFLDNTVEGYFKPKNFSFDEETFKAKIGDKEIFIGDRLVCTPVSIGKNKEVVFELVEM